MTAPQYASLTAGLLARKGEAAPSKEPSFGHRPWQPPVSPVPAPAQTLPQPPHIAPPQAVSSDAPRAADALKAKVRLNDVSAVWPSPRPSPPASSEDAGWVPNKLQQALALGSLGASFKTTIRLTHAQARAVKLAALILDKPQQDILTAGLIERLEALACTDLAKCSCFNAVIEGLRAPERGPQVEEPPLAC
jgi:hypothetical protein